MMRNPPTGRWDGRDDRPPRLAAPADCTESDRLCALVASVLAAIERRPTVVVIDLAPIAQMNSMLVAAIIYLAREARRGGVRLRLEGVDDRFLAWAGLLGVDESIRRSGVLGPRETD